jgi:5-methyltetrahydrofolate--homocysteine methyltransferase
MDLSTFLTKKDLILLDGGMGTQLAERGAVMGGQSTLSRPDTVLAIHKDYAQCGCHILIANTFAMNRVYIETHKLDIDVRTVNVTGVQLAKQAADHDQYILGDIGSTGKLLEPYGDLKEPAAFEAFAEQAVLLEEGGVDGFIIETMTDLKEALCALRACKEVSALPVIVTIAFSTPKNGGRTIMGNKAEECARAIAGAGAQAVGANCGDIDPFQMAEIVAAMHSVTDLPILAKPNAGRPRLVDNKTVFDMSSEEFVKGIKECISAGATMVGGCCGTAPDHICALADIIIKGT